MEHIIPLETQLEEFSRDPEIKELLACLDKLDALYRLLGNLPIFFRESFFHFLYEEDAVRAIKFKDKEKPDLHQRYEGLRKNASKNYRHPKEAIIKEFTQLSERAKSEGLNLTNLIAETEDDRYDWVLYHFRYYWSEIEFDKSTLIRANALIDLNLTTLENNKYRDESIKVGPFFGVKAKNVEQIAAQLIDAEKDFSGRFARPLFNVYLFCQLLALQSFRNGDTRTAFSIFTLLNLKHGLQFLEVFDLYRFTQFLPHIKNYGTSFRSWLMTWELDGYKVGKASILYYLALSCEAYFTIFSLLFANTPKVIDDIRDESAGEMMKIKYTILRESWPEIIKWRNQYEPLILKYIRDNDDWTTLAKKWYTKSKIANYEEAIKDLRANSQKMKGQK